ncbi:MAG TPA: hypothetical protein VH165_35230 [Kofleriaceae bacterium]|nr:hypothetical protein [Kofleriaceae bacterium]
MPIDWQVLVPNQVVREQLLQTMFDHWPAHGHIVAGTPPWLDGLKVRERSWYNGRGYRWQADVELDDADGQRWVIELKHGAKYEPLALAEVLHHAHALGRALRRPVKPAIICSYNSWLRMALWYLKEQHHVEPVAYCEALVLRRITDTRYVIWFDLPFAARRSIEHAPAALPASLRNARLRWHRVDDTRSWLALPSRTTLDPASPFIEGKYLQLTEIPDGGYVLWLGEAAGDGTDSRIVSLPNDYFIGTPTSASIDSVALETSIRRWLA